MNASSDDHASTRKNVQTLGFVLLDTPRHLHYNSKSRILFPRQGTMAASTCVKQPMNSIDSSLCRREEGRFKRPCDIMKWKCLAIVLLMASLLLFVGAASAAEPFECSMVISPSTLSAPGAVNVTITIKNTGAGDMEDPLILLNPASALIKEFGTNGEALLKAGETIEWTGKWDVNARSLENGFISYYVKYSLTGEDGIKRTESQTIRGKIEQGESTVNIDVKRVISPPTAGEGQEVVVQYDITNTGVVTLQNITIQENSDVNKTAQKIPALEPGTTAQVKFPVKMGKKDLKSSAVVTYQGAGSPDELKTSVEEAKIVYGEQAFIASLASSAKGVVIGGKVTLTLTVENKEKVDFKGIRVSDPLLGDVFTDKTLEKSGTLKLETEVTVPVTTEYRFTVHAVDQKGAPIEIVTAPLRIEAIDPSDAINLTLTLAADRTEVFEQPGKVRFSLAVSNDGNVEAKDVVISHGATRIYTFPSIPAGETRRLTRDAALSMEGTYQFSATAVDVLENSTTFKSNEIRIAFSVPTPAPATPTPVPDPTPEPVFVPVTVPPIQDPSVATAPKAIQIILLPILILASLGLLGSGILLIIATQKRAAQKRASEAAYDQLERSKRRDYTVEKEEPEVEAPPKKEKAKNAKGKRPVLGDDQDYGDEPDIDMDDYNDLPHMKYVRGAAESESEEALPAKESSFYDDDFYKEDDEFSAKGFGRRQEEASYDEQPYRDDAYEDNYEAEAYDDADAYAGESYREEPYERNGDYRYTDSQGTAYENDSYGGEAYNAETEDYDQNSYFDDYSGVEGENGSEYSSDYNGGYDEADQAGGTYSDEPSGNEPV